MKKADNTVVEKALRASKTLKEISDQGLMEAQDNGCVALCGLVRDCAYKISEQARSEQTRHVHQGLPSKRRVI